MFFDAIAHQQNVQVNEQYEDEMKKIISYFNTIQEEVDSVEQLKFYMYDTETIRKILAQ